MYSEDQPIRYSYYGFFDSDYIMDYPRWDSFVSDAGYKIYHTTMFGSKQTSHDKSESSMIFSNDVFKFSMGADDEMPDKI